MPGNTCISSPLEYKCLRDILSTVLPKYQNPKLKKLKNHIKNLSSNRKITINQALKPIKKDKALYKKLQQEIIQISKSQNLDSIKGQSILKSNEKLSLDKFASVDIVQGLKDLIHSKTGWNKSKKIILGLGENHLLSYKGASIVSDFLLTNIEKLKEEINLKGIGLESPCDINLEEIFTKPSKWKETCILDKQVSKQATDEVTQILDNSIKELNLDKSFSKAFNFRSFTFFNGKPPLSNYKASKKNNLRSIDNHYRIYKESKLPIHQVDLPLTQLAKFTAYLDTYKRLTILNDILNIIDYSDEQTIDLTEKRINQIPNKYFKDTVAKYTKENDVKEKQNFRKKINTIQTQIAAKLSELIIQREQCIKDNLKQASELCPGNLATILGRMHITKTGKALRFANKNTGSAFQQLIEENDTSCLNISVETLHKFRHKTNPSPFDPKVYKVAATVEGYLSNGNEAQIITAKPEEVKHLPTCYEQSYLNPMDLFDAIIAQPISEQDKPHCQPRK